MWSQREYLATRRLHTTRQCGPRASFMSGGGSRSPASLSRALVIVQRRGRDLGAGGEGDALRHAGEIHLLSQELIRPVLARDFDQDDVGARLHELAALILPVPFEGVAARRPRGARDRVD